MTKKQQALINHLKAKFNNTGETLSNIGKKYEETARELEAMGIVAVLGHWPTLEDVQIELLETK